RPLRRRQHRPGRPRPARAPQPAPRRARPPGRGRVAGGAPAGGRRAPSPLGAGARAPADARGPRLPRLCVNRITTLYVDVDGTLVGPGGDLLWDGTSDVVDALLGCRGAGVAVVPVTGRGRLQ